MSVDRVSPEQRRRAERSDRTPSAPCVDCGEPIDRPPSRRPKSGLCPACYATHRSKVSGKDVRSLYERHGSLVSVAAALGVDSNAVARALRKLEVPIDPDPPLKYPVLWDARWMRQRYVADEMTIREIAQLVGCERSTVWYALVRLGIDRRPPEPRPMMHEGGHRGESSRARSSNRQMVTGGVRGQGGRLIPHDRAMHGTARLKG